MDGHRTRLKKQAVCIKNPFVSGSSKQEVGPPPSDPVPPAEAEQKTRHDSKKRRLKKKKVSAHEEVLRAPPAPVDTENSDSSGASSDDQDNPRKRTRLPSLTTAAILRAPVPTAQEVQAARELEEKFSRLQTMTLQHKHKRSTTPVSVDAPLLSGEAPLQYEPGVVLPGLAHRIGQSVVVEVLAQHLTTHNKRLRTRQIWGTDLYSADSDVVAMLVHTGHFVASLTVPPFSSVTVTLRVEPPQEVYVASVRNFLRSRRWSRPAPFSLAVKSCTAVEETTGQVVSLRETGVGTELSSLSTLALWQRTTVLSACGTQSVKTGSASRSVTPLEYQIQFNFSNDPCLKYALSLVNDHNNGQKYTSQRLKTEVLFLETDSDRYELAHVGTRLLASATGVQTTFDSYCLSRVLDPRSLPREQLLQLRLPLCVHHKDRIAVVYEWLDWDELQWGPTGVLVRASLPLVVRRIQFVPVTSEKKT
eukprot:gnl/Spiro4/5614_TR2861_c0_g1_i1.p1 gnl/Spiro4/5614_TR2861_c0_g1~~gnl/Spiro4/5614_TR2861_c0_g1_i1.p1  ORF type:complete len:475 (-),score=111.29 gnl/Spiro4/5614_TR2861_c0_g1_i1:128-1552(-)